MRSEGRKAEMGEGEDLGEEVVLEVEVALEAASGVGAVDMAEGGDSIVRRLCEY